VIHSTFDCRAKLVGFEGILTYELPVVAGQLIGVWRSLSLRSSVKSRPQWSLTCLASVWYGQLFCSLNRSLQVVVEGPHRSGQLRRDLRRCRRRCQDRRRSSSNLF
jgi:hypothetical protein